VSLSPAAIPSELSNPAETVLAGVQSGGGGRYREGGRSETPRGQGEKTETEAEETQKSTDCQPKKGLIS